MYTVRFVWDSIYGFSVTGKVPRERLFHQIIRIRTYKCIHHAVRFEILVMARQLSIPNINLKHSCMTRSLANNIQIFGRLDYRVLKPESKYVRRFTEKLPENCTKGENVSFKHQTSNKP
jgi:hypothetical protein